MNIKKLILAFIVVLAASGAGAQVNLQTGSMQTSIPVHSFQDKLSSLSFGLSLNYSSGNGLVVDELSGAVGTGWDLSTMPFIRRIEKGLPDDQVERVGAWNDTTKFPPGYMYNTRPITAGCPSLLTRYPIFTKQAIWYDDNNDTKADRDIDEFQYVINGKSGSFVIDKNQDIVLIDESRLKISIIHDYLMNNCRTTISEFRVTDENGLVYTFNEKEMSKVFKTDGLNQFSASIFAKSTEVPLQQNPYIVQSWYVSKITDSKSGRQILFNYNTEVNRYEYKTGLQTEIVNPNAPVTEGGGPPNLICTTPDGSIHNLRISTKSTRGVSKQNELIRKNIKDISYPDGTRLILDYATERKDLTGTNALSNITILNTDQSRLFKYRLTQDYFIKNEIRQPVTEEEKKWARLCLTKVQRFGATDLEQENAWSFGYYQGSNATEDFVAPAFFHAKDPFGYYNGSYCGVNTTDFLAENDVFPWAKVCLYNQGHNYAGGSIEIYYNCKAGYAKNGLLKTITNPFGGVTEYEYKQRYAAPVDDIASYDTEVNGDYAVGGVNISRIIERKQDGVNDRITEYSFTGSNGKSSLWGIEAPRYQTLQQSYWKVDGDWSLGDCDYEYKYPGNQFSRVIGSPRDFKSLATRFGVAFIKYSSWKNTFKPKDWELEINHTRSEAKEIGKLYDFRHFVKRFVISNIYNYAIQVLINCVTPPDDRFNLNTITHNGRINRNQLPQMYKTVFAKTYSSNNLQTGSTEYSFTSADDSPLIIPQNMAPYTQKRRAYEWMYGLPKSVKQFDNTGKLMRYSENTYLPKNTLVQDDKTLSCDCEPRYQESFRLDQWIAQASNDNYITANTYNANGLTLKVEPYNITRGYAELQQTTEKVYDANNDVVTTVTNFFYNNTNKQLSRTVATDSRGRVIENKTYYAEDYNLSAFPVLKAMVDDNMFNAPVSSETWQTKPGGQPELLSASVTEYGTAPNGDYRPIKSHSLQTAAPVPLATIGSFDPTQLVRNPALIKPDIQYVYDAAGNAVQTNDLKGNRVSSVIFDYNNMYPVAAITNAAKNEVAYTSFEADGANSNWNLAGNGIVTDLVPTGNKCLEFNYGNITTPVAITKEYILSFWASSNSFTVNGGIAPAVTGPTINGWTFYQYKLPAGTASPVITGTYTSLCRIDELRLYPANAGIATTTYNPGIGKTSVCDLNNRIAYFEYDGLGRPSKERDEQRNLIKTYEYHYKQ